MLKSVLKEIIIILLLIVTILLLLGILFYDYMPNSKTMPSKVEEYALAEDVKLELDENLNKVSSEEIIKTYQIDGSDLEHYEKTKEYNKGKVNPFAQYSTQAPNNTNTNNNSNTNTTNNESTGNFLNTVGK